MVATWFQISHWNTALLVCWCPLDISSTLQWWMECALWFGSSRLLLRYLKKEGRKDDVMNYSGATELSTMPKLLNVMMNDCIPLHVRRRCYNWLTTKWPHKGKIKGDTVARVQLACEEFYATWKSDRYHLYRFWENRWSNSILQWWMSCSRHMSYWVVCLIGWCHPCLIGVSLLR